MTLRVDVEWRKGDDGLGGTYFFDPRPNLLRPGTIQKFVEFKIPLRDGSLVQLLNNDSRTFALQGVLAQKNTNFDDLDEMRRDLVAGVGNDVGQLHIISNKGQANSKHFFYNGIPIRVTFSQQTNSKILDYVIEILLADPTEVEV